MMKRAKVRTVPTSRSIPEWQGKTPDSIPPPHVERRIFDRYCGRCYLSGREIRPGDVFHLEHIKSLRDGGLNVESNLAPALVEPHKAKTKRERKTGQKSDRIRSKHLGLHKSDYPPMAGTKRSGFKHKLNGKRGRDAWERRA